MKRVVIQNSLQSDQRQSYLWASWQGCLCNLKDQFMMALLLWRLIPISIFLAFLSAAVCAETASLTLEDRVKAAYIYNILKFTRWPENILPNGTNAIHICILGRVHIAEALMPAMTKTAQGHPIIVEEISTLDQQKRCHALVISPDRRSHRVLNRVENSGMLTISSQKNFAANGGMIGFVIREEKVKIEVNLSVLRQAGIQLSSKLLEIAILIKSDVGGSQSR